MPFVTSRAQASRRAGRRRPRQLFELQQLQSQYKQNVLGAQGQLQSAQNQAASEFSDLSKQYETGLSQYRDSLAAYEKRGADFSTSVDKYINTISEIENATSINTARMLANFYGLNNIFGDGAELEMEPVPDTPADPGTFTERFDMRPPTAPTSRSIEPERQEFERRAAAEKVALERGIGERKAGSIRARRRMTDRNLLQRS